MADRFVLDRSFVTSGTGFADGGDFNVTARVVELSNGGLISVQALGDSKAGDVHIVASEGVTLSGTGEPTNPFSPAQLMASTPHRSALSAHREMPAISR